jgi:hypothetical protein
MQIDNKDLLTLVKSFARANPLPLDKDEIKGSITEAEAYIKSPIAYPGQTIKVLMENGQYKLFILQQEGDNLFLKEPEVSIDENLLKQYVQIVDTLPELPELGVIYILTTDYSGSIWTGSVYKKIFGDIVAIDLADYARLDGATFTGDVILASDPILDLQAATKGYVDKIVASGGSNPAAAIKAAKDEAIQASKDYTNSMFVITEF